jgi:small subunit ribosomal protein S16
MLVIRMQRTGRKGHAMFRVVVQDSRRTPTSGKLVAALGSYDPHSKNLSLNKEKASFYLEHGAQPSDRVARLLKAEGVKLPGWVKLEADKERDVRNADKRRSTRPEEPKAEEPAEEAAPAAEPEATPEEQPAEESAPVESETVEKAPAEEPAAEAEPEKATEDAPEEAAAETETPVEETKEASEEEASDKK